VTAVNRTHKYYAGTAILKKVTSDNILKRQKSLMEKMVKVGFRLERDQDNYPPADWEWLWASRVSDSTFKIDNIPFFAKLISYGDVVEVKQTNTGLIFNTLVQPSGHSTVRVIVHRRGRSDEQLQVVVEDVRVAMRAMGCSVEKSHIPGLIAVDVPPEVNYQSVAAFLSKKESEGLLGYEEACLAA
jgi:hypothetical protein